MERTDGRVALHDPSLQLRHATDNYPGEDFGDDLDELYPSNPATTEAYRPDECPICVVVTDLLQGFKKMGIPFRRFSFIDIHPHLGKNSQCLLTTVLFS